VIIATFAIELEIDSTVLLTRTEYVPPSAVVALATVYAESVADPSGEPLRNH
jgi:hypothetical protein